MTQHLKCDYAVMPTLVYISGWNFSHPRILDWIIHLAQKWHKIEVKLRFVQLNCLGVYVMLMWYQCSLLWSKCYLMLTETITPCNYLINRVFIYSLNDNITAIEVCCKNEDTSLAICQFRILKVTLDKKQRDNYWQMSAKQGHKFDIWHNNFYELV